MSEKYFEKFPVITYANNQAVDITKRVALMEKVSTNPYVFYPYDITTNERADQLSNRYYDDSYRSWIFYLTNKIVDPYYEWYMAENEFEEYIDKKYGSFINAKQKVMYYRNNWETAIEETITVSEYNALNDDAKLYFERIYDSNQQVMAYKRAQLDWRSNTNKVCGYQVNAVAEQFKLLKDDEIVTVIFNDRQSGNGQFLNSANTGQSNVVVLQHLRGTFETSNDVFISNSSYLYGTESQIKLPLTNFYYISNNISDAVEEFWAPVSYYEYETERNEYNKSIRILDSSFKDVVAENLKDLMKV